MPHFFSMSQTCRDRVKLLQVKQFIESNNLNVLNEEFVVKFSKLLLLTSSLRLRPETPKFRTKTVNMYETLEPTQ